MLLQKNETLLMIGDSITDNGRTYPVGDSRQGGLGKGYVGIVEGLLKAGYPEIPLHILNMGISGNTVRDLASRWQQDVLDMNPDWLSIMIGTNDVWRHFDLHDPSAAVPLPEFTHKLDQLVAQTKPRLSGGLVLMPPFYVQTDKQDPMRAMMDRYGQAVREIAAKNDTLFADTQAQFDRVLEFVEATDLAPDQVHPAMSGDVILARAFLKSIGD